MAIERKREGTIYVEAGVKRKKRLIKAVELLRKDEQKVTITTLTTEALDEKLERLSTQYPQLRVA